MAYYPDLSSYSYRKDKPEPQSLNIAWLTQELSYTIGDTSGEFLTRLLYYCPGKVNVTRGIHYCELCIDPQSAKYQAQVNWLGSAEIRVFHNGKVYAAPDLIVHYVREHNYRPPDEFVTAILNGPLPESEEYRLLIRNLGVAYEWNDQ